MIDEIRKAEIINTLSETINALDQTGKDQNGLPDQLMEIIATLKTEWNIED